MIDEQWGVGSKADGPAFDDTTVGEQHVGIFFGEHPHSRQDNKEYARFPDGNVVAFDGFRVLIDVNLRSSNYLKDSDLSGQEIRKAVDVDILFNGQKVYEIFSRNPLEALLEARAAIKKLCDLPVHVWKQEELDRWKGKRVNRMGLRYVIAGWLLEQGCVLLNPANDPENPRYGGKTTLLDPRLDWFPDEEPRP